MNVGHKHNLCFVYDCMTILWVRCILVSFPLLLPFFPFSLLSLCSLIQTKTMLLCLIIILARDRDVEMWSYMKNQNFTLFNIAEQWKFVFRLVAFIVWLDDQNEKQVNGNYACMCGSLECIFLTFAHSQHIYAIFKLNAFPLNLRSTNYPNWSTFSKWER